MTQKEKNKLIERTAKRDAYSAVVGWAKNIDKNQEKGSAWWYANEKMLGHESWLQEQEYFYDYALSDFVKKYDRR